jgi:hypothetical protein
VNRRPRVRRLSRDPFLGLVLATVVTCLLVLIIWSMDRGLDISDESLYLLSYLYPNEYPAGVTMFHVIVSRLTGWMHPTVLGYRWLTLALRLIVAIAFTCGFWAWFRRFFETKSSRRVSPMLVFLFFLVGYVSPYGIGPPTLNYNSINSALVLAAASLLLYVLSQAPTPGIQPGRVVIALFGIGFSSALDLFVKFPTAIIMLSGALLLIVLYLRVVGPRAIAIAVSILVLGTVAGLTACVADAQSLFFWFSNYRTELRLVSEASHNPSSVIRAYLQNGASLLVVLLRHFLFAFLATFAIARCYARGWHRQRWRNQYLLLAVLTLTIIYVGYKVYALDLLNSPYFNNWATFYTYVLIIAFQVIVLMAFYRAAPAVSTPKPATTAQGDSALLGMALLVALPFTAAIGTANNIFLNALYDIEGWFAIILVLGVLIEERTRSRLPLALCILLPTCLGAGQLIYGMVWKPYLLAASLPEQTVTLQQPASVAGLKVDPATARFITELRSILGRGSFHENDYILAFYNAPGLVLFMGGISPGKPQYFKGQHPSNCRALENGQLTKRPVFILATQKIDVETTACLQKAGLRFPDEFVELGRVYNPYSASSYGWRAHERWVTVFQQTERR